MAELARLELIDLEVARTGIERARLAADGEGELHRVAMVLEAWAGNDERVEREWLAACAQAEELEAGSVPSPATESLLVASQAPAGRGGVCPFIDRIARIEMQASILHIYPRPPGSSFGSACLHV